MIKLNDEKGITLLSIYGSKFALGFEGDESFIERSFNLYYNYGATNGALHRIHDGFSYIVLSDKERLLSCLEKYFYSELHNEFKTKETYDEDKGWIIEYDESKLIKKSQQEAELYFNNIQLRNFALFKDFRDDLRYGGKI